MINLFKLSLDMEVIRQTFHPSRYPKEHVTQHFVTAFVEL